MKSLFFEDVQFHHKKTVISQINLVLNHPFIYLYLQITVNHTTKFLSRGNINGVILTTTGL